MPRDQKVVVVMPAYNAAKTLCITYADLPPALVDQVILVDDTSSDDTVKIARELGLELFVHNRNHGYGADQKTCSREALNPMRQGMPWWKYVSNRFLTLLENRVFGLQISEDRTGYRAYRRGALEAVNLETNSDNFLFDKEVAAQFIDSGMRIREVPVPARYFPEASSASFLQSTLYGLSILRLPARYLLHCAGLQQRQFQSLHRRYERMPVRENRL